MKPAYQLNVLNRAIVGLGIPKLPVGATIAILGANGLGKGNFLHELLADELVTTSHEQSNLGNVVYFTLETPSGEVINQVMEKVKEHEAFVANDFHAKTPLTFNVIDISLRKTAGNEIYLKLAGLDASNISIVCIDMFSLLEGDRMHDIMRYCKMNGITLLVTCQARYPRETIASGEPNTLGFVTTLSREARYEHKDVMRDMLDVELYVNRYGHDIKMSNMAVVAKGYGALKEPCVNSLHTFKLL